MIQYLLQVTVIFNVETQIIHLFEGKVVFLISPLCAGIYKIKQPLSGGTAFLKKLQKLNMSKSGTLLNFFP